MRSDFSFCYDFYLEIPANLRLQADSSTNTENPARLMVSLPSLRKTPPIGRLGRIRISIAPQQLPPTKKPTWLPILNNPP